MDYQRGESNAEYKKRDRADFIKLDEIQKEYIEAYLNVPGVIEALSKKAENVKGRYKYFQLFYNTRLEKEAATKDRASQSLALAVLKKGISKESIKEVLINNKLRLLIQKQLKPVINSAFKSDDPESKELAIKARRVSRELDAQRAKIILNKQKFAASLANDFYNVEREEIEQIAMTEMIDIVEKYNLDEKISIFTAIKYRVKHTLKRMYFSESRDVLDKNTASIDQPAFEDNDDGRTLGDLISDRLIAEDDQEFDTGIESFKIMVSKFPKKKKFLAEHYFFNGTKKNAALIADQIGHSVNYVHRMAKEIENDFRATLH